MNKDKRGNTDVQTRPSSGRRWLVHLKNVQTQPFKSHYQGVTASHTPQGRLFPISLSRCGMWLIIRWGFCLSEGFVVAVVEGKVAVSLWVSCAWACSWPWSIAPQRRKEQPWHQERQTLGWFGPPLDYSDRALFLRKNRDMDYCNALAEF